MEIVKLLKDTSLGAYSGKYMLALFWKYGYSVERADISDVMKAIAAYERAIVPGEPTGTLPDLLKTPDVADVQAFIDSSETQFANSVARFAALNSVAEYDVAGLPTREEVTRTYTNLSKITLASPYFYDTEELDDLRLRYKTVLTWLAGGMSDSFTDLLKRYYSIYPSLFGQSEKCGTSQLSATGCKSCGTSVASVPASGALSSCGCSSGKTVNYADLASMLGAYSATASSYICNMGGMYRTLMQNEVSAMLTDIKGFWTDICMCEVSEGKYVIDYWTDYLSAIIKYGMDMGVFSTSLSFIDTFSCSQAADADAVNKYYYGLLTDIISALSQIKSHVLTGQCYTDSNRIYMLLKTFAMLFTKMKFV